MLALLQYRRRELLDFKQKAVDEALRCRLQNLPRLAETCVNEALQLVTSIIKVSQQITALEKEILNER